jgi:hypothetical protein
MRESMLHKIAISVVAAMLGSAVLATDAIAAGGRAAGAASSPATAAVAALAPRDSSHVVSGAGITRSGIMADTADTADMADTAVTALPATMDASRSTHTAAMSDGRASLR